MQDNNCFRKEGNLFRKAILRKSLFLGKEFSGYSLGGIRQGTRKGKEMAILIKRTFCILGFFGRSLVLLWFFLGILHGDLKEHIREGNLNFRYKL